MRRALLLTTAVATVVWAMGCSPAQQAGGPPTPTATSDEPAATPAPTPTPTPTPTAADGDVAVMLDARGRVVVVDAATGEERRELLDGVPVDDPASNDVAMASEAGDIFVVVPPDDPPGAPEIVRVNVDGGDQETIGMGTVPAVSPDEETLAYVVYEERSDSPGSPEPFLVLRDLDTGDETRLSREQPFHFIPDVEWTADGTRIVFTAGEIHTGLYVVDSDADSLDDARRLGPDVEQENGTRSWGPVAPLDEGRLAVVATCCGVPSRQQWHVAEVNIADGSVAGSLLPDERVEATHVDGRSGSSGLLIVVRGGPDGGALLRWDGAGEPEQIADGIIAAAW